MPADAHCRRRPRRPWPASAARAAGRADGGCTDESAARIIDATHTWAVAQGSVSVVFTFLSFAPAPSRSRELQLVAVRLELSSSSPPPHCHLNTQLSCQLLLSQRTRGCIPQADISDVAVRTRHHRAVRAVRYHTVPVTVPVPYHAYHVPYA